MKIKWSLDINTGAAERSEVARARRFAGVGVYNDPPGWNDPGHFTLGWNDPGHSTLRVE